MALYRITPDGKRLVAEVNKINTINGFEAGAGKDIYIDGRHIKWVGADNALGEEVSIPITDKIRELIVKIDELETQVGDDIQQQIETLERELREEIERIERELIEKIVGVDERLSGEIRKGREHTKVEIDRIDGRIEEVVKNVKAHSIKTVNEQGRDSNDPTEPGFTNITITGSEIAYRREDGTPVAVSIADKLTELVTNLDVGDDKILSLNAQKLRTTLSLDYANGALYLLGIDKDKANALSRIDLDVKSQINHIGVHKYTGGAFEGFDPEGTPLPAGLVQGNLYLVIKHTPAATASGKAPYITAACLNDLIDVYTAGHGLQEVGNEFSVKIDPSSANHLSTSANGLKFDLPVLTRAEADDQPGLFARFTSGEMFVVLED